MILNPSSVKKINTFHSGFENWFAKFSNVPYRYVFRQLSSEVSHLHSTPLKSRQSAKIRTTVIWGAWERKSRCSACRRSNVSLPICLYFFLMQCTVVQIFIKVLNIRFFPITLRSLRFMIHAKNKPNNGLSGVELRFRELLSISGQPTTSILPDFTCKNSKYWKSKVIGALFFAWKVSNPSKPWFMLYSLRFLSFQNYCNIIVSLHCLCCDIYRQRFAQSALSISENASYWFQLVFSYSRVARWPDSYETHVAYLLRLIHCTYGSTLQPEL